jgi:hypothetical protein
VLWARFYTMEEHYINAVWLLLLLYCRVWRCVHVQTSWKVQKIVQLQYNAQMKLHGLTSHSTRLWQKYEGNGLFQDARFAHKKLLVVSYLHIRMDNIVCHRDHQYPTSLQVKICWKYLEWGWTLAILQQPMSTALISRIWRLSFVLSSHLS